MIVIAAVKQVADPMVLVRVRRDGAGLVNQDARPVMNPFDAIALEAALCLREAGEATEVIVVTVGPVEWEGTVRTALAIGADRAIRVVAEDGLPPLSVAKVLAAVACRESATLIITGRQSVDCDQGQTGPMVAGLLGWGEAAFVVDLQLHNEQLIVKRAVEGGIETVALALPAVITADLQLNTPRYATLPNIMRARNKPLEQIDLDSLGLSFTGELQRLELNPPRDRKAGIRVKSAEELVSRLQAVGLLS